MQIMDIRQEKRPYSGFVVALDCYAEKPYGEFVLGAFEAARDFGCRVVLVGRKKNITVAIDELGVDATYLDVVDASEEVEMGDTLREAMRKKDSSMIKAVDLLEENHADCFVTAGNTGIAAYLCNRRLGHLKTTNYNPILARWPCFRNGSIDNLYGGDLGARVEASSEHLVYTAVMESCFLEYVCCIKNPRIALLNIGEEENKGSAEYQKAHKMLRDLGILNFVGNIEPHKALFGEVDGFVCSGEHGNYALKAAEAMGELIHKYLKSRVGNGSLMEKIGALFLRPTFSDLKRVLDRENYGGAAVLGIARPAVISHGTSGRNAVRNSIAFALQIANSDLDAMVAAMEETAGRARDIISSASS